MRWLLFILRRVLVLSMGCLLYTSDIPLPISWDILQEEKRTTVKKQLEFYFPQAKGKKILSILLVGQKPEPEDGSEP